MSKAQNLAAALRKSIEAGDFDEKGKLPSHDELSETYGVSVSTVGRAIGILKARGVVQVNHAGTFIGPRAGSWKVECHECGALFEAPGSYDFNRMRATLQKLGWGWRGSASGWHYYCSDDKPWS